MTYTPGPWKPGQDRYLVVDMREGKPTRKKFYTIEARLARRKHTWLDEIIFCRRKADRDFLLTAPELLAACEAVWRAVIRAGSAVRSLDDFLEDGQGLWGINLTSGELTQLKDALAHEEVTE